MKKISTPATIIGCTCHDFINVGGHGQCKTSHSTTGDQPFCYVNQPSNCTDLLPSETDPGRKISAKACEEGIFFYEYILVRFFPHIIVQTMN